MKEARIPNKIGRVVLMAMDATIGNTDLQTVLARAGLQHLATYPLDNLERDFPAGHLSRLMRALEETYGAGKGRELALQSGRRCFHLGAQDLGLMRDLADLALPILPTRMRAKIGLVTLAEMFNHFAGQAVHLKEENGHFHWVVEHCGVCQGRKTTAPCCHLLTGLLQELLYWCTGGDRFSVTEVSCTATGAPHCAFQVEMQDLAATLNLGRRYSRLLKKNAQDHPERPKVHPPVQRTRPGTAGAQ